MWFAKYFPVEFRQELPTELAFERRDQGIWVYTHAPCTASKSHTQPGRDIFHHTGQNLGSVVLFSSAHHDGLSWLFSKSQKSCFLQHRIIARGRASSCKFGRCKELGNVHQTLAAVDAKGSTGRPQIGFTFHCGVILPGDWAHDLYHSEFYLQIGKWQGVL